MKSQITKLMKPALCLGVAALALIGSAGATRAYAADRDSDSKAPTTILTAFEDIYWRWTFGNITLPTDQNGNAVVGGVALMPLPNAPGDGTPASIDVTLKAGEPFFLPLIGLLGTSYTDGTPPDPFVDRKVFGKKNLKLKLKLDGKTILEEDDALDFYTEFSFDPPIPLNSPPLDSIIYSQGVGILHAHILKRAAQRGDGGILKERTVPSIVCAPVGDQLRLHGLVVSIIEDGVEYHDADRDLLHSRERQFGG